MIFQNDYHWVEVKSMGHRFIESMRKNEFDLPQKTWKKNHQNRAEKYSDRNKLIPSLTTELALLKICLVSKRYELQNVKPNDDMLRGKKGRQNVGERDTTVRVCKISFPTFFSLFFFLRSGLFPSLFSIKY